MSTCKYCAQAEPNHDRFCPAVANNREVYRAREDWERGFKEARAGKTRKQLEVWNRQNHYYLLGFAAGERSLTEP